MDRLVDAVEAERESLAELVGSAALDIVAEKGLRCRAKAEGLAILFYRSRENGSLSSIIERTEVPEHPLGFYHSIHAWLVLRFLGEEWPRPTNDAPLQSQLKDELGRIGRAVGAIRRSSSELREILLFEAGYMRGYASWGQP